MEKAAQRVLDARAGFPGATLADLYDPLAAAHAALDRAVDKCYRPADFPQRPRGIPLPTLRMYRVTD